MDLHVGIGFLIKPDHGVDRALGFERGNAGDTDARLSFFDPLTGTIQFANPHIKIAADNRGRKFEPGVFPRKRVNCGC